MYWATIRINWSNPSILFYLWKICHSLLLLLLLLFVELSFRTHCFLCFRVIILSHTHTHSIQFVSLLICYIEIIFLVWNRTIENIFVVVVSKSNVSKFCYARNNWTIWTGITVILVTTPFRMPTYIDESNDTSPFVYRSVARRKTDLMPTIPIRDTNFGSRTSLYCSTPRTQGKNKIHQKHTHTHTLKI